MSELLCAEYGAKGWKRCSDEPPNIIAFVEWICTKEHSACTHKLGDVWQASMICCNTCCSGYWRPINRYCEKHGLRLRDCWQCENETEFAVLQELVDGCYSVVALWNAQTPAQLKWQQEWLKKALMVGASAD